MKIEEAVSVLIKELNSDEAYRMSWKANIAMAFKDNWHWTMAENSDCISASTLHEIANKSADFFLSLLCRDTTKNSELPGMLELAAALAENG